MGNSENTLYIRKQKICLYVWRNYNNDISLKKLSQELHLSERTCERVIHDHLHSRLKDLINAVRLYKTIDHYQHHNEDIIKSAIANGFTDRRNFQRWWNKWMNTQLDHVQLETTSILRNMKSEYKALINTVISCIPENNR